MSNSPADQEDRVIDAPDRGPDYKEQEELRRSVSSLASVASDGLVPLSPVAAKVQGEDLMVFSRLMECVQLNPAKHHDQGVCHSLKQAYARIARLRPEDIAGEADHAARLRELKAAREQTYRDTRYRLVQIAQWAADTSSISQSPSLTEGTATDIAYVREARRRSELSAWVDQQIDELNQINL